jgi:hypothetical protein
MRSISISSLFCFKLSGNSFPSPPLPPSLIPLLSLIYLLLFVVDAFLFISNKLFSFSHGFGCVKVKGNSADNSPPSAPEIKRRIFTLY